MSSILPSSLAPVSLSVIVQGFARAWSRVAAHAPLRLPTLDKLMQRGTVTTLEVAQTGWPPESLRLLKLLDLTADSLHASGPLEWLGQGGVPRAGVWIKGEFVHLEVGSRSARLHRVAPSVEESRNLLGTLQVGLKFDGIEVLPPPDLPEAAGCFLYSAAPLAALCPPAEFAVMSELRDLLPQGSDGPMLRRLLTEVQMLLHDHPVNALRAARGERLVNALWLTGLGEYAGQQPQPLPQIATDDAYLKGLCRLHGVEALPLPRSAQPSPFGDRPGLVALSLHESADPAEALRAVERDWIAPLTTALESGHLKAVQLLLDTQLVRIDRTGLRRFWRRGPGLAALSS